MAVLGASIVFSGLVVLSLAISQLHKLLLLWENRKNWFADETPGPAVETEQEPVFTHPDYCPEDIQEAAAIYRPLFEKLGETFLLADLYNLSRKSNFPHPHITISRLREAHILEPVGDGIFQWKQS